MNKILEAQNVFTSKVSLQLQHVEHRFKRRIEQPPFRLDSNRKHYERKFSGSFLCIHTVLNLYFTKFILYYIHIVLVSNAQK